MAKISVVCVECYSNDLNEGDSSGSGDNGLREQMGRLFEQLKR